MGSSASVDSETHNNNYKNPKYPGNLTKLRKTEFARLKGHTYLDFTGSGLYSTKQVAEYVQVLSHHLYGNPHSANPSSERMSHVVNEVRQMVLEFFGTDEEKYSVIFTAGTTASLKAIAENFKWTSGKSVYAYLEDNHTSVVGIREVAHSRGAQSVCLRFPENTEDLSKLASFRPSTIFENPDKTKSLPHNRNSKSLKCCHLFAYPGQSNFSGRKYPLDWIEKVRTNGMRIFDNNEFGAGGNWFVVVDAAALVSSSPLDLSQYSPDFVTLSFYKMFGFPTGIGALLVRNEAESSLRKKVYFGGGTTEVYLPSENFSVLKPKLHEIMEEGTIAFLDILGVKHGLHTLRRIAGSMQQIRDHTFTLTRKLHDGMKSMRHRNDRLAIRMYPFSEYDQADEQGPIISFNVLRNDGSYVGYNEVIDKASKKNIHLRGGCFCNVGSCNHLLKIGDERIKEIHKSGYKCGEVDLVDKLPVGAVRASLGYISTEKDVKRFLKFLRKAFVAPS